ncbi:MAG TPA: DNA repair protein RecN, partial [Chloroflexota bacterium]
DLLAKLKRKYAPTLEELISYTVQIRAELEGFETIDDRIEKLRNDVAIAEQDAGAAAASLSEARKSGASTLSVAMAEALQGLGLGSTRFEVQLGRERDQHGLPLPGESDRFSYSRTGIDSIQFLVSFNIGEPMRPIERVASGGETSRFLLALKSVLADADQIPTLIFDEVDVGVGGRAAVNVGERVRELARAHQVLSITHLPQLAALADYHISVSKSVSSGRTTVAVDTLDRSDRVVEIAHMLAGTDSAAARHNAEELLEAARRHR